MSILPQRPIFMFPTAIATDYYSPFIPKGALSSGIKAPIIWEVLSFPDFYPRYLWNSSFKGCMQNFQDILVHV